jgi:hypothetical protein
VKKTIWTLIALSIAACGEVTAEPIVVGEAAFSVNDIEVEDVESNDPYACEVVALPPRGTEDTPISSFISLGDIAYGGRCQQPTGGIEQCWYTSSVSNDCVAGEPDCGGFTGSVDYDTGVATLQGGQHMLCEHPCTSDEQCPAPASGTALATCMRHPEFNPATDGGSCMLGCGNGETCPDGFVCILPGLGFGQSDGSVWQAPAQCVQYKRVALVGAAGPS